MGKALPTLTPTCSLPMTFTCGFAIPLLLPNYPQEEEEAEDQYNETIEKDYDDSFKNEAKAQINVVLTPQQSKNWKNGLCLSCGLKDHLL